MRKLITATAFFLALATTSGTVPYNAADKVFSAYAAGPDLNNLSIRDGRASYQWVLKSDGQAQKITQKLNIDSLDPAYMHRNKRGRIDAIALPPLESADILVGTTNAVPGININTQSTWQVYSQVGPERPLTAAAIDTGVDIPHPDLQGSIWVNEGEIPGDGIDNDGSGFVGDVNSWNFYSNTNQIYEGPEDAHGTHAIGTITASEGNGGIVGIAGSNYVKIVPIKTLGGEDRKGSPENIIATVKYAEANGAQICNLGFGSQDYTEEFKAAIRGSGMLFVAAAGNGDDNAIGCNIDVPPICPASPPFDNVIAIANLMFDDTPDMGSSFGVASVDIAAPGIFILGITPDSGCAFMSGTSMAAPMVTGVATTLYASRPELSLPDTGNVILASTHKTDSLSDKVSYDGIVDANGAMYWGRQ